MFYFTCDRSLTLQQLRRLTGDDDDNESWDVLPLSGREARVPARQPRDEPCLRHGRYRPRRLDRRVHGTVEQRVKVVLPGCTHDTTRSAQSAPRTLNGTVPGMR